MKYLLLILFIGVVVLGCKDVPAYKVEIDYEYGNNVKMNFMERYEEKISEDTVLLCFEEGFSNASISIEFGDSIYNREMTTDPSLGVADWVFMGNKNETGNLKIRINNCEPISLKLRGDRRNIYSVSLNQEDSLINILWLKYVPWYE